MVAYTCHSSTQEAEAGGSEVQGRLLVHSSSKASVCLKQTNINSEDAEHPKLREGLSTCQLSLSKRVAKAKATITLSDDLLRCQSSRAVSCQLCTWHVGLTPHLAGKRRHVQTGSSCLAYSEEWRPSGPSEKKLHRKEHLLSREARQRGSWQRKQQKQ